MNKENQGKFYITTAIPYVNALPHLGFALEIIQADVIARFHRAKGEDVYFLTGTDENSLKNVLAAEENSKKVEDFVRENAESFKNLKNILNLSWDDFIRTTEERHTKGAQKLWSACKKEDIYKKNYEGVYCVGCEEFKTPKELINNHCPEHPNSDLESVKEENYFFKLTNYQKKLEDLISSDKIKIIPETRKNETLSFIKQGLQDFSISRSRARAHNWGIPVPGDETQVLYVWFDALANYISALGYVDESEKFEKYWQNNNFILHVIGKGVSRFHAVYWPAMLMSAGLKLPDQVFIHGYITIEGQKISKSLGNVIDPKEITKKYGVDALRYYLLREIPSYNDGDFSVKKFEDRYNGDLANGLGNFVSRVLTLGEKFGGIDSLTYGQNEILEKIEKTKKLVDEKMLEFKFHEALACIWELISYGDQYVNEKKPWAIADNNEKEIVLANLIKIIEEVAKLVEPFIPETSEKISKSIENNKGIYKVKKSENLFPRSN
ncbi:MAG: methionine--tRNA ligase [Patescibacteria group bacterium]|nr:methionine--tRNA ligase [Patescibacteria group bacterium]